MTGRRWSWGVLLAWTAGWAWLLRTPSGISWHFFPQGAGLLFGADGLHLYARHPELQIGPLTFAAVEPLAGLPAGAALATAQVLSTGAGLLALWLAGPVLAGPGRRGQLRVLLAGLVLMPCWTVLSVRWTHPDDVLALLALAAAVRAVAGRRGVAAGLLLGTAMLAKPWAVGFAPLLLGLPAAGWAAGLAAGGLALAGVAAAGWLPFLVADSGTLAALHPPVLVADTSVLRLAGIRGDTVPGWTRTAQFLLAPAVALVAVLRGRWAAVPLVAVAVRLALDPQDIGYYTAGAVLAAVVADLGCTDRLVPWATVVTALAWWHPFVAVFATRFSTAHGVSLWWFQHPTAVAWVHLAWTAAALAVPFLPERLLRRAPSPGRRAALTATAAPA